MVSTKFYMDARGLDKDMDAPIKLLITKDRKNAYINLGVKVPQKCWNKSKCRVVGHLEQVYLNNLLLQKKIKIDKIIEDLQGNDNFYLKSPSRIKKDIEYILFPKNESVYGNFYESFNDFISIKKGRTKELYECTLNRLSQYDENIKQRLYEDVDYKYLDGFDNFMKDFAPSVNARSIHFRNIRAVFNHAITEEKTNFYPFRKFKIKKEVTKKRNLSVERLREIFSKEPPKGLEEYFELAKLIFLLIGVNVVDLCKCKNVTDGRMEFNRAKTHRFYSIKIEDEAMKIISKYKGKNYMINQLDKYKRYQLVTERINRALRKVSGEKEISTYWLRHSWATIAVNDLDIPLKTIACALGHGGYSVTDIYINFDQKKVDEANRKMIDWVFYGKK